MAGIARDLAFAIRLFRQQPGFTAVALITLSLGIGGTTAIFSVVNAIILRPLPFEQSHKLVLVFENNVERGWPTFSVAPANFATGSVSRACSSRWRRSPPGRRFFGERDPLGQRIKQAGDNAEIPWMTIVGVVGDVRHFGLSADIQPEMFWPEAQATWGATLNRNRRALTVVVRAIDDAATLLPAIRLRSRHSIQAVR